jgi:hypothetical protein
MMIIPTTVFYDEIIGRYAMPMNIRCEYNGAHYVGINNAKFNRKLRHGTTVYKKELSENPNNSGN